MGWPRRIMTAHRVARYQATGIGGKDNKAGGGRGATLWDRAPGGIYQPRRKNAWAGALPVKALAVACGLPPNARRRHLE